MTADLTAAIEAVRTELINEGAADEGGVHSWRCFDKDRYPEPCTCVVELAGAALGAALPHIREELARQWTAKFNELGVHVEAARKPGDQYSLGMVDGLLAASHIVNGDKP